MNTKTRQRKGSSPFRDLEAQARQATRRAGLYLLGMGDKWTFYSTSTGRPVLTYLPRTRYWSCGTDGGTVADWREAVRLAVLKAARSQTEAG